MKILIIEDQIKLAKLLKSALEKEGHAADYLTDGLSGQKRIELHHQDYDLVILDLMLPKKSGYDVCKSIRSKNITIPILILTAKDKIDDKVLLLDMGADDYLVKPFSLKELLARIRALSRRPETALPETLKVKNITLHPASKKAYCNGKELKLTLKEFRLLEYFMRHSDQAVDREDLIAHVWGFDFDSFSNVVDVHVSNLRKKLEKANNCGALKTIRGIGYRMAG